MPRTPAVLDDLGLLVSRVVLIAHGWQKFSTNGMDATVRGFEKMGAVAPRFSAWFATIVEIVGGGLLILGAGTLVVGLLVVVDMLGALLYVHVDKGLFVAKGAGSSSRSSRRRRSSSRSSVRGGSRWMACWPVAGGPARPEVSILPTPHRVTPVGRGEDLGGARSRRGGGRGPTRDRRPAPR